MGIEDKQIIIGIGTGRCGTNSFAKLMNSQPDCFFSHESYIMDWGQRLEDCAEFDNFAYLANRHERIVGDITLGLTTQAKQLIMRFPNLKVCCITRDREKLVDSLLRASGGESMRSFFQTHPEDSPWHSDYWYRKFPAFNQDDKKTAIRNFISEFYFITSALYKKFPERVFMLSVENMNNADRLKDFFDFCGIPEQGRNYGAERTNSSTPGADGMWKNPEQISIV